MRRRTGVILTRDGPNVSYRLGINLLGTYRVNAGTVFFVGYDNRYRDANKIDPRLFATDEYRDDRKH